LNVYKIESLVSRFDTYFNGWVIIKWPKK
jgi:hypothetical protein